MHAELLATARAGRAFDPNDPPRSSTLPFVRRAALLAAWPLVSRLVVPPEFRRLYERAKAISGGAFCSRALEVLDVTVALTSHGDAVVPSSGPLVVVANHPHGIVDGLALAEAVGRTRRDVRVLTNELLASIPELDDLCLFVNAFDERAAGRTRAGLRAALRWLQGGHALIVFPAGAVAHHACETSTTPIDGVWRDTAARLAATSGAAMLPAFIAGRNTDRFYRAGALHGALRTLLLIRELLAKRGTSVAVTFGRTLVPARHRAHPRQGGLLTTLLRAEVEKLAATSTPLPRSRASVTRAPSLSADVARLSTDERLVQSGRFEVYCAPAARLGDLLPEIGRLREITFRSVGEGTGREIDLDRFDAHYEQLFVWDREARAVAGAYRLGPVDRIVAAHGIGGLYTSTLYNYDQRLLSQLGPAIELGRSFVRSEYQRSSNALQLLWKGIAQFVARSGKYRVLFGPVSISSRYTDTSRQLLQAFLLEHARHRELADLVTPVTPPSFRSLRAAHTVTDVRTLERLIVGEEADGKGIPVLLRQYLRLNAKLLAFNIDPAFGDALDALMMVDLADVERAILARYFGAQNTDRILGASTLPSAAA